MFYCGIDIGTTNTKAVLVHEDGRVLKRLIYSYLPTKNIHRFDAKQWCTIFCDIVEKFNSESIGQELIVSITSQGASFVLLDKATNPIDFAWPWTGQANLDTVKELARDLGDVKYYNATGWQPLEFLMPCKIREYIRKTGRSFKYLVTVPDYITAQLTGKAITDATNAQMTGFYDINSQSWREDFVKWAGCEMNTMSAVKNSVGVEFENVKTKSGRISLVTSSHDQYAAMEATGTGIGTIMLGTGTAWVINGKSREPVYDDENFSIHPGRDTDGGFGFICTMGPVGRSFDIVLNTLGLSYSQVDTISSNHDFFESPIGAIIIEPDGKTSAEAVKQFMLGVASLVRFNIERLSIKDCMQKLVMTGGATANSGWCQMIADVCGVTVEAMDFPELTAYGAAMIAKRGASQKAFASDSCEFNRVIYEPVNRNLYKWYDNYQREILLNNANGFIILE